MLKKARSRDLRGRRDVRLKVRPFAPASYSRSSTSGEDYSDACPRGLRARLASSVRQFLRRVSGR
jgi:hypothetical protein